MIDLIGNEVNEQLFCSRTEEKRIMFATFKTNMTSG